jgi:RimJ/RimL family protein N-acetyltransferase
MQPVAAPLTELVIVTRSNYTHVIELCVSPEQEHHVGTAAEAIADLHFNPSYVLRAVAKRATGEFVGLIMYEPDTGPLGPHTPEKCIRTIVLHRFFIDCKHQAQGLGRDALRGWIREALHNHHQTNQIQLIVHQDALDARRLYERAGFRLTPIGESKPHYFLGTLPAAM